MRSAKKATLNLRLHEDTRAMWHRAAELLGVSLTELIEDAVNPVAARAILRSQKDSGKVASSG